MSYIAALCAVVVPVSGSFGAVFAKFKSDKKRNIYILIVLAATAAASVFCAIGGKSSFTVLSVTSSLTIAFSVDELSIFFSVFSCSIWLLAGIYSFGYMSHDAKQKRFYVFYLMTLGVINGIVFSANLFTLYIFYEAMTLLSFPLVMHEQTGEAIAAGKKYLIYSFIGAALALIGIFYFYNYSAGTTFSVSGVLSAAAFENKNMLLAVYFITIIGFGCKAGLFPLHSWLTAAHPQAPSPASAVLSGVITKMGVFAIIRTTFYVVGVDFVRGEWVQTTLIILAMASILIGSVIAFRTFKLKKRLAYSSISQVSYVLLGIFLLNETAFAAALLQVIFHGIAKSVLFMCAGSIITQTGKTDVNDMRGIGKEMKTTMLCFAAASLSLIGIPPMGGFVSKGYLVMGALSFSSEIIGYIASALLMLSALFTAGYLLPVSVNGFFPGDDYEYRSLKKIDVGFIMKFSPVVLTLAGIAIAVYPHMLISLAQTLALRIF